MGETNLNNWMGNSVGTIEAPRLTGKDCTVVSIKKVEVAKRDKTGMLNKIVLTVKHPDSKDNLDMSDVAYIEDKTVKQKCLWYFLDSVGEIQKGSTLAVFLLHYGATNIGAMVGKTVKTEAGERGYLCLKAY
jgi:hypothetical protein